VWAPAHPAIRRLVRVMAPAVLGASVFQLNILISRLLASFEGHGAVSNLYYASRLIEFPLGVFVFAIGTASLPMFSRCVKQNDREGLRNAFSDSLALVLALALPSALGLILLRKPLFSMLFSWNPEVFGVSAIDGCAQALFFYALGLIPITVSRTYVNLCMSHENARTPARAAGVSLLANAVASLMLVGPLPNEGLPGCFIRVQHALAVLDLGYPGLALAASLGALANAVFLAGACHRRYGGLLRRREGLRWLRLAGSGSGMAFGVGFLCGSVPWPAHASLAGLGLLAGIVLAGALLYGLGLWLLRSPDLALLVREVRRTTARAPLD